MEKWRTIAEHYCDATASSELQKDTGSLQLINWEYLLMHLEKALQVLYNSLDILLSSIYQA